MCWSPTVTLFFVCLELLCLTMLWSRGHRALVVGAGGLWLQECVQLLLWWEIERDEARGGSSCSASNERLTLLELFAVVGLVPSGFAIMAIWSMESLSAELQQLRARASRSRRWSTRTTTRRTHQVSTRAS